MASKLIPFPKMAIARPRVLISLLLVLAAPAVADEAIPAEPAAISSEPTVARTIRPLVGWQLHISRRLLAEQPEATAKAIRLLEDQLEEVVRVVPAEVVAKLRKVPLYFSPGYPDTSPRAEYHPDAGWLREHGRDPAMARAVEFTNIPLFEQETRRMPNFALHELAHAYHHRELPDGFANRDVIAAFERARAGGRYERVERRDSEGRVSHERAYAMTNPQEYFAESSEAYFSRNDFYPSCREELRQHDPFGLATLETLWGVSE